MNYLILTPEVKLYGIAILFTCSLGCSNLASHLYSRWFLHTKTNMIFLHWIVKMIIVSWGLLFIPLSNLFSTFNLQIISVLPAIFLGIIAVNIELFIQRKIFRQATHSTVSAKPYAYLKSIQTKTLGIAVKNTAKKVNLKNVQEHYAHFDSRLTNYSLRDIILVALCEEVIFRGFLWQLALVLPNTFLITFAGVLITLLFGASHITLGKGQFVSKTILGTFCLVSVITTHSIIPAILIHMIFNVYAYQYMKKRGQK